MDNHIVKKQKLKVVGYIRVSTSKQEDTGLSIKAQKATIIKYSNDKGYKLGKIYIDVISGKTECLKRKEFIKVIADLTKNRADGVIITKFDRLSRNLRDLIGIIEDYFKDKYKIFFTDFDTVDLNTIDGILQMNMFGSFSQWERGMIAKRTKSALDYKKSKNHKLGGYVPYGFKIDIVKDGDKDVKILVPNIDESSLINELRQYRSINNCSYSDLAKILINRNIKNRDGKVMWTSKKVAIMCYPELYPKKKHKRA